MNNIYDIILVFLFIYIFFACCRLPRKDVFIPVHLYGQLVQHKQGFNLLESQVIFKLSNFSFSNADPVTSDK